MVDLVELTIPERLARWSAEAINQWADEYEPKPAWEKQVSKALFEWDKASTEAATLIETQAARIAELESILGFFNCIDFDLFTEHDQQLLDDTIRDAARALNGGE